MDARTPGKRHPRRADRRHLRTQTLANLKSFQAAHRITPTGQTGPVTWHALLRLRAVTVRWTAAYSSRRTHHTSQRGAGPRIAPAPRSATLPAVSNEIHKPTGSDGGLRLIWRAVCQGLRREFPAFAGWDEVRCGRLGGWRSGFCARRGSDWICADCPDVGSQDHGSSWKEPLSEGERGRRGAGCSGAYRGFPARAGPPPTQPTG